MANEVVKLQSGLSGEPQIATFAIGAPQSPRAIGDQQCDLHSRAGENLCCPGGRNPLPVALRERSNSWRNRNWAISNRKSGNRVPPLFSAFGPIFLQTCTLYWECRFAGYGNKWPSQ